jgi:hypothetical protein
LHGQPTLYSTLLLQCTWRVGALRTLGTSSQALMGHSETTLPLRVVCRQALDADEFVEGMKKKGIRVPGIGHRIKSKDNRDKRVELLQHYARRCGAGLPLSWHS